MAYLQHNQFGIKDVSHDVNIPNNDVARLMYYLNCVCFTISYTDNDIRRFCNYNNWSVLSNEDIRMLVVLCHTLNPTVFIDKVFFQSDALCGNYNNRFLEINQVRTQLLAVESIVIAGRRCQVNKIMTYKVSWMENYYINPMKNIIQRLNAPRPRQTSNSRSGTCTIS